ncbi:hypothetical protein KAR91_65860, partial [Candidatus Pacearchaeota archaeon]|nr:hypothetical protein [Candidatus Pacearchaeota archaeon]
GNDTETDTALRIRRELSLRILGAATIPAITARLLQEVTGVTGVNVLENDTSTYGIGAIIITVTDVQNTTQYRVYVNGIESIYTSDASATEGEITAGLTAILQALPFAITVTDNMDGTLDVTPDTVGIIFGFSVGEKLIQSGIVPPNSLECVVEGGTNEDVANKIWEVKAGGIGTWGNVSEIIQDSEGDDHLIMFSRPTKKYAWIECELTLNLEETFPIDGLTQVQENLQTFGFTLGVGDDFIIKKFIGPIYDVPGIADNTLLIGVTNTPVGPPGLGSTNIPISDTEVLDFTDIAKIDVDLAP